MTDELIARIKNECNYGDIQTIIDTIEGEPTIFTFWGWTDIENIIKEKNPNINISLKTRNSIMQQLNDLEYFPSTGEDMVNAIENLTINTE